MELNGYVEALQGHLVAAASSAGPEATQMAERLTGSLDAAARLVIQDALADAAQEITRDLAPGSVELRLRGRELTFVVTPGPSDGFEDKTFGPEVDQTASRGSQSAGESAGEGSTSRISFRPPDHLKARIEDAAEREGLSVNAFLVRTLTSALDPARSPSTRTDRKGATRVEGWFR